MFIYKFRTHKLILSILTGLLLVLSWPARGFPFLIFFAFIPLLFLEDHINSLKYKVRARTFFVHAWLSFLIFNLFTTWWIMYATLPGMIAAVILNSLFMTLPWLLMHLSRRILPSRQGPVSLIMFWLAFEFLHGRWELSWSWLDLGNVFAGYPAWVQWYAYTGTAGGALWILAINILLFLAIKQMRKGWFEARKARINALMALSLFIVPAMFSFHTWLRYEEDASPTHVVVVQPAQDPYDPAVSQQEVAERVEHMIALADEKINPATRFVVTPEGANPRGIWRHEAEMHYTIRRIREHQEEHPGVTWLLGSFVYAFYDDEDDIPASARLHQQHNRFYDVFNAAVMIPPAGDLQYHYKYKLVPGIERMPYFTLLRPLGRLVDRFGGIAGSLGTSESQEVMISPEQIRIAPSICYESIYGDYTRGFMLHGASMLFIMTNDGWWRDTPGYRQHNQYARLRAIETRRSIARSASTGISAFINQRGETIKETAWWEATAIAADINKNHRLTFFSRSGNYLGRFATFLGALFILYMISQRIIGRQGSKK